MGLGANIAIFAVARSLTTAPALRTLVAAGVLVLALTCANAISLLLARMTREHRRLFIRIALGAERSHLIRQALAEGAALSGIALGGGLTCALALVRAAALLAPEGVPGSARRRSQHRRWSCMRSRRA